MKPSWEGVQRAGSLMECKQTLIKIPLLPSVHLSPLFSVLPPYHTLHSVPLVSQWAGDWGQCMVVPLSAAVPLESCSWALLGWLHGSGPCSGMVFSSLLFQPGHFFLLCSCFLPFLKCIFFRDAINPSDRLSGTTSLADVLSCGLKWVRWSCLEPAVSSMAVTFPQSSPLQPLPPICQLCLKHIHEILQVT